MENNQTALPEYVWVVTSYYTQSEPVSAVYLKEERAKQVFSEWKITNDKVTIQKRFLFTL